MSRRNRIQVALWLTAFALTIAGLIWLLAGLGGAPDKAPSQVVEGPAQPPAPPAAAPAPPAPAAAAPLRAALAPPSLFTSVTKERTSISRTILFHDPPQRGASAEEAAVKALESLDAELAPSEWVHTLAHRDTRRIPAGTVVRFQQESQGVPVLGGGAIVLVGPDGGARYATVRSLPGLPAGASKTPAVSPEAARRAAEADFDIEEGVESLDPGLFVVQDGPAPTLAWVVPLTTAVPFGSYLVQVDASTADVLETKDILQSATGHGRIFLTKGPTQPMGLSQTSDNRRLRSRDHPSSQVDQGPGHKRREEGLVSGEV